MNKPSYGLVGRGRVAAHVARYLSLEDLHFLTWHRGMEISPEESLASAEVILLLISDDSIEEFARAHPALGKGSMVHFSGSLVVDGFPSLHPLTTFGPELYDLETYRTIPFIEEEGGVGFQELFPTLPNPSWKLDPDLKPLYHALCVLSGNFSTLLWSKAIEGFEEQLGLPREVLKPYLEQTGLNTLENGRRALTGSLARGDRGTVERDLSALEGDPYAEVYRAFANLVDNREESA